MKQALRLLSRFILTSILLVLVLGSLVVLFRYVIGYDPQHASAADVMFQMLAAMREVFAISLVISASVATFATIRLADRPFVPLVLLAGTWTVLLVLGSLLWSAPGFDQARAVASVPEDRIIRVAGARVFSPSVEGLLASPVLVHQLDRQPGFELFTEGIVDPETRALTIPGRADIVLDLTAVDASYPAMVAAPDRLNPLLQDISGLNRLILGAPTLLLAVALGVFLLSCWTPARLTRWPLFNAVLVFLSVRGALWLVNSIHFGELGSLLATVARPDQLGLVSAGVLAFISLVFIVTLVLLPPLSSWKREVGDE
ncbi:MAG: hypothetical protein KOO61_07645 [Spirochaetales bacterium]|nr:hypothetical protein [Spirochaetales bacterium]